MGSSDPGYVYRQLDLLTDQLGKVMAEQVDPREFGKLEGAVDALKADVDSLKKNVETLSNKMDLVLDKLNEAKGGWRALMMLGGAGATLGTIVTYLLTHSISIGPKP